MSVTGFFFHLEILWYGILHLWNKSRNKFFFTIVFIYVANAISIILYITYEYYNYLKTNNVYLATYLEGLLNSTILLP